MVIVAIGALVAASILIATVASSAPPRPLPPDTGPGPTTQLGVGLLPDDPANPSAWSVLERVNTGR